MSLDTPLKLPVAVVHGVVKQDPRTLQDEQLAAPEAVTKVPEGHGAQLTCPFKDWYCPVEHALQVDEDVADVAVE